MTGIFHHFQPLVQTIASIIYTSTNNKLQKVKFAEYKFGTLLILLSNRYRIKTVVVLSSYVRLESCA